MARNPTFEPANDRIRKDPACRGHATDERCYKDGLGLWDCGCVVAGCTTGYTGQRVLTGEGSQDLHYCEYHDTWATIVDAVSARYLYEPDRTRTDHEPRS